MIDDTALRAALRAVATPDLYRDNPLRPAGFHIGTAGTAGTAGTGRQRRSDPATRLVDEFFWFWPEAPFDGDVARADAAWEAAGTDAAHHNLAVLNHMLALDIDHGMRVAAAQWRRAYRFWLRVWRSDTIWGAQRAVFREELPLVLARVAAAVAVRWAERRQTDDMVRAHWQLVEYDGFPDDVRAAARKAATESVAARIGDRVEQANEEVRRMPMNVARTARAMHDDVGPALHTLDLVNEALFSAVHDAVALQLLKYTVVYYEQTEDWGEGLKLLYLAENVGSYRVSGEIRAYARKLERVRDEDQRRAGPGHRYQRLPTFHRPVPDLSHLDWPSDLS